MSDVATKPTDASPDDVIDAAESAGRREDARILKEMMDRISGEPAVVWGPTMVGYGSYRYTYESGHSGEAFIMGFSPRKASMSIYGLQMPETEELLGKLGKVKIGKACVWVGRFSAIDLDVLEQLIREAWSHHDRWQALFPADA